VPVIATEKLVKHYGRIEALQGVSLTVERGEIFGLLGQNGAGKTTLIKILLGITRATGGTAQLLDQRAGAVGVRRHVGYLPEDHRFPDYHTGVSLLDFYGALLEVPGAERARRIPEYLELVGLKERMRHKIRTYSKGMKQRLGIAQALFHRPDVIFLDEPTDGVDPVGRREIRELMLKLKAEGKTIFLNSHLLGEVEQVCDRVAFLLKGRLVRLGSITDLLRRQNVFLIGLAPGQQLPAEELARRGYHSTATRGLWEVVVPDGGSIDPVTALLHERGLHLRHLAERRQSLEELFLAIASDAEPGVEKAPAPAEADQRVQPKEAARPAEGRVQGGGEGR
jgi:ABC-2 type transport system ATP-binding protein